MGDNNNTYVRSSSLSPWVPDWDGPLRILSIVLRLTERCCSVEAVGFLARSADGCANWRACMWWGRCSPHRCTPSQSAGSQSQHTARLSSWDPRSNEWINGVLGHDSALVWLYWGQPGLIRKILLWIMSLVLDWSLDLLTSSPAHYHCANGYTHILLISVIYMQDFKYIYFALESVWWVQYTIPVLWLHIIADECDYITVISCV